MRHRLLRFAVPGGALWLALGATCGCSSPSEMAADASPPTSDAGPGAPGDAGTDATREASLPDGGATDVGLDGTVTPDSSGGEGPDGSPDAEEGSPSDSGAPAEASSGDDARSDLDGGGAHDATVPDAAPRDASSGADTGSTMPTDSGTDAHDAAPPPVDCSPDAGGAIGASGAPRLLACTGLYSDWAARAIAPSAVLYDPGLHLWSDGAVKKRYIALPPGTQIDTSDMDEWQFPLGTKVWKEFALGGKKIETRYLSKEPTGWVYTTYQWSPDQSTAAELTTGALNVNGTGYEIPELDECRTCHMGRLDFVLGFEAISLSTPLASGITMTSLVAGGWLTDPPAAPLTIPGDATASASLAWLHANCGTACHNSSNYALAGPTGFFMRLQAAKLGTVEATDTFTTGVNVTAKFKEPDGGAILRIAPGDPAGSCVVFRAGHRDTMNEHVQMPPDDSHVVDTADLATVESWIGSL